MCESCTSGLKWNVKSRRLERSTAVEKGWIEWCFLQFLCIHHSILLRCVRACVCVCFCAFYILTTKTLILWAKWGHWVRVRVGFSIFSWNGCGQGWVRYHACESPHKDSTRKCVCNHACIGILECLQRGETRIMTLKLTVKFPKHELKLTVAPWRQNISLTKWRFGWTFEKTQVSTLAWSRTTGTSGQRGLSQLYFLSTPRSFNWMLRTLHQSIAESTIPFAVVYRSLAIKREDATGINSFEKLGQALALPGGGGEAEDARATLDNPSHPLHKTVDNLLQQETDPNPLFQGAVQEVILTGPSDLFLPQPTVSALIYQSHHTCIFRQNW